MSSASLRCLVISDGRRGIENQAVGLAEAAARQREISLQTHILPEAGLLKAAPARVQLFTKSSAKDYGLPSDDIDIAIGCGRQAIAPLLALKKERGNRVFTVYIQDPRIDPDKFDLVVAPEHDGINGPNIETMIGSPNRVNQMMIVGETLSFAEQLSRFPMPRAALLIGGDSKTHGLLKSDHEAHISTVEALLKSRHSLLITTSRRTPAWAKASYEQLAAQMKNVWLYTDGDPNPYFAFLGGAEHIFVTEESTNMLTEACVTGKPVYRLPMSSKRKDGTAGKFEQLYTSLEERCGVRLVSGRINLPDYTPLDETARVAKQLWAHFDARSAAIN